MGIFEDKVRKYNERLKKDFQINDIQACGIWGNLGTETGGFTALQEKNPVVKGSRGGYGWLQWTGPRRRKYEAYCKSKGLDPAADETNYQYFVHETLTDEWKSIQQVRKTTTIEAATETFMLLNLRPGIPHLDNRKRWAARAQAALKTSPAKPAVVATSSSAGLVGTGLLYYYWEQVMNYWPWAIGIGAAALIALIVYLVRNALND
jgi:hypothetical protein